MNLFLDNIYQNSKFILLAHVFNPLWNSRIKRRQRRGKYSYIFTRHYLKKYLPFIESLKIEKPDKPLENGENKIFSIWFQGEENAPQLVKVCFQRLRDTYGSRFVILNKNNLKDWVSLPDYIWRKWNEGKITFAHFSDICRVALLYQNGGMWFDATDYLISPVPQWIEEADLFIFLEGEKITPGTMIQSCFMRAKKKHPLFKAWLDFIFEYWQSEDRLIHYFLLHYMLRYLVENNSDTASVFREMLQVNQDPTHTLWYLHADEPYSKALYEADTKDSFFQKTSFKGKNASQPIPGSVADYIVNDRIKF